MCRVSIRHHSIPRYKHSHPDRYYGKPANSHLSFAFVSFGVPETTNTLSLSTSLSVLGRRYLLLRLIIPSNIVSSAIRHSDDGNARITRAALKPNSTTLSTFVQLVSRSQTSLRPNSITLSSLRSVREPVRELVFRAACARRARVAGHIPLRCPAR